MGPVPNDEAYTGTISLAATQPKGPNLGTSFSAPIVSGIADLMLSVNSNLTRCGLIARLKEGALPFPQTAVGSPPACHVPTGSTDLQNAECICTSDGKTCGAGMANAKGAVEAALRPIAAVSLPSTVSAGQTVVLNAGSSAAANGHTISSYQWTDTGKQSASLQNATSSSATVTAPSCGYVTVQITVTDDVGRVDTANVVLDPASATSIAPTDATAKACTIASPPQALLAVCPATANVQASGGSQPFTVSVANTTNDAVTWQVNGVPGGNSTVGTITSAGVYTAPTNVPAGAQVMITAISTVDQSLASSSTATITSPPKHGGGALDPLTLAGGALALGVALRSRRYARR
jgi:serine protease